MTGITRDPLPRGPGHREGGQGGGGQHISCLSSVSCGPPATLGQCLQTTWLADTASFWTPAVTAIPAHWLQWKGGPSRHSVRHPHRHPWPSFLQEASYLLCGQLEGHGAGHRVWREGLRPAGDGAIALHGAWGGGNRGLVTPSPGRDGAPRPPNDPGGGSERSCRDTSGPSSLAWSHHGSDGVSFPREAES